jgi:hypothetical protein
VNTRSKMNEGDCREDRSTCGMPPCGSRPLRLARAAAMLVLAATFGASAHGATASGPVASSSSITGKSANLNGAPLAAGATLFPGDVIRIGAASTAALQFKNGFVLAAPETELVVQSEGVSLRGGRLQVRAGGAKPLAVSGPFFHVNIAATHGMPGSAEIRLAGTLAQISAFAGVADLASEGYDAAYRLRAGETATLDASSGGASPPAQGPPNPDAGQISRMVPQVQIDRDLRHIVAAVSERVDWDDDLRSGPTGRAHVALNDGSQLNLGSDSSLLILRHDAQAQQTSLDLIFGRLRGQIMKLTRAGAKFEIQTPVGVAGLVGTDFSLQVTNEYVELIVFEGAVRFTTLDGKAVTVPAGMRLRISRAGVMEGPFSVTPQEEQIAKNLTDITQAPNQAPVATARRHLVPIVVTLSSVAAAGLGIGVWEITRPKVSNTTP